MILEKVNGSLLESKTIVKVKIIEMKRKKKSPEVNWRAPCHSGWFFLFFSFLYVHIFWFYDKVVMEWKKNSHIVYLLLINAEGFVFLFFYSRR